MNRNQRLEVIEQILLNHPDGLRVVEISALCKVDRRTIYRDLEYMQEKGLPLWQNQGKFGIERESYLAQLRINANEAAILIWAVRFLSHHLKPRSPHIVSLFKKIMAALPPELNDPLSAFTQQAALTGFPHPQIKVIEILTTAWIEGTYTEISYPSQNNNRSPKTRFFAPYVIDINSTGQLFTVGLDSLAQEVRPFLITRISRARLIPDKSFEIPANFDAGKYMKNLYVPNTDNLPLNETVVLRLHPKLVKQIEKQKWYANYHLEYLETGRCLMIAEITDGHEMENWIQLADKHVEIIAPLKLRKRFPAPTG